MHIVWNKKSCAGAGGAFFLLLLSIGLILIAYIGHEEEEEQQHNPNLLVNIRQGTLIGRYVTTRKGRNVLAFEAIPYAKPPIGYLRFQSPQPPEKWEGVLDATKLVPKCTQRDIYRRLESISGQEDCLYINVYTPHVRGHHLLDVMVYIHGGGWVVGAGINHRPDYLMDKDIVLVTFNYRLGPLGFLSTGDAVCPGNNGLKDQTAALRWVRQNIAAFGGNPGSVTIFGENSGGASVHFHMLSPASRGLFHRAISQSGTGLCPWSLAPHGSTREKTEKLALLLNCTTESSRALIDCLHIKDNVEITAADKDLMEWNMDPFTSFKPVVETGDDAFLPASPLELAKNITHSVPWITGITSGEGAFVASRLYGDNLVSEFDDNFEELAPLIFFFNGTSQKIEISNEIKEFYFEDKIITSNSASSLVDMFTEGWFLRGTDLAVKLHVETGSAAVFYYYFNYRGSKSFSEIFGGSHRDYGVCHADDLLYLFPMYNIFRGRLTSEDDDSMIDTLTTMWTNFARHGEPTRSPLRGVKWPHVSNSENKEYVKINKDGLYVTQGLLKNRTMFWDSLSLEMSRNNL
ncbi:hypothetical protein L9F63_019347 [Diploptera punctata]|uniref:Carboxylesterase type B domain-containing protein n=1 Tax=Diploptera punctata TaxID=6984 RepID=A0AAD7ZUE5_DIPPU|nr:hypothetical protein L9F63_019347 [Diploptera punctata]